MDISEKSVAKSQEKINSQSVNEVVQIHHSDSVAFLGDFEEQVDFIYLDSYDYDDDPEVQIKSQVHHLNEFVAIEDNLHDNSIVLIDDCDLPNGGKGKLVAAYMLKKEWKILLNEYQILLVRKNFSF
ncbi:hypothetical protein [Arenibacter certesii]|uniref:Uncharacterized protein n=1 Tax=Arenibacter certesii TaxID=228955 RepID=A0A918MHR2_9FLAO|nr:hypothetical protein [Arenibacter certesii]GGW26773.1 hypothetical protein GCM10007383_10040 [Arenibacter certesii]